MLIPVRQLATVTNLNAASKYYFVVKSYTGGVESSPSNEVHTLVVSNAVAGSIASTGAVISWNTDEVSDSQVSYGTTASYGTSSTLNSSLVTLHSVTLTGLLPSTLYHFKVASKDANGNGSLSNDYTFTTTTVTGDAQAPTVPAGLTATAASSSQINLNWNASSDNVGVTGYRIYRGGTQIATSTTTSYSNTGLTASTAYSFTVAAYDAAGNVSTQSAAASATTQAAPDTQAPGVPAGLTATAASSSQINLNWNASIDNVGVTGYRIYRGGTQIATSTSTTFSNTGLTASTAYSYSVAAYDAAGNVSAQSAVASATTQAAADSQAPGIPSGLTATATSSSQISLNWNASTDNVAVTGYRVLRGGIQIAVTNLTTFSDSGLTASTAYSYSIAAFDAAGNVSAQSVAASATTQASANSQPPVLAAISSQGISSSGVTIVWTTDKASDSQVEFGTTISYGSVTVLNSTMMTIHSVILNGLSGGTTYHFRVKSKDAAGNLATSPDATFDTLLPAPGNVQVK